MGKIKGWKLIREGKKSIHWWNNSQEYRGIPPTTVLVEYNGGKETYDVAKVFKDVGLKLYSSKSRAKARKFAVAWMKKHPRG